MSGGGAERTRRYRERKRKGVACVVRVLIYATDVAKLVEQSRLPIEKSSDSEMIASAVGLLVDDFVKGWLVGPARPL
jgi:hypothetical protein